MSKENPEWKELKSRIKKIAKEQKKQWNDIFDFWNITSQGATKRIKSVDFPYSKSIHDLADFLNCTVPDILGETEKDKPNDLSINQANNQSNIYNRSVSGNNFFSDEKTELAVLRAENEQLKKIIDKQDKEIEFLRGQLMK